MDLLQMGKGSRGQSGEEEGMGKQIKITSINVDIICHKHELRLTINKNVKGNRGTREGEREGEGRGLKIRTELSMYLYLLPKMTVKCMCCKHALIKLKSCEYSSVVMCVPSIHEALGSNLSTVLQSINEPYSKP